MKNKTNKTKLLFVCVEHMAGRVWGVTTGLGDSATHLPANYLCVCVCVCKSVFMCMCGAGCQLLIVRGMLVSFISHLLSFPKHNLKGNICDSPSITFPINLNPLLKPKEGDTQAT